MKITVEADDVAPQEHRMPVNVCIVLDRSGSMRGSKIEFARQAAIEAVRRLHPDDILSLVTYDSTVETVIPAQHPRDIEWIEEQIRNITPRGMTALFGGVSQGAAELRKNQEGRYLHRMILLSDGIANVGPSQPSDLGRLGASLLKENIQVSTLGVGLDYNEDLMTVLAERSGGNVHFIEDSRDLPRILTAELGEAQQLVAGRVTIEITLPSGVTPVRIIGREGRVSSQRIEVPIHSLGGGQSRYALVEVETPPQAAGQRMELATARILYDDLVRNQAVTSEPQGVSVAFSGDTAAVDASLNRAVEQEVLANRLAISRDQAVRLADEGRLEESAEAMRDAARAFDAVGNRDGRTDLQQRAREIEQEAARIEQQGLDKRARNVYRAKSFQERHQQKVQ